MSRPSLNKVFLIGFLTQSPVVRYAPNGTPVTSFPLAVSRGVSSEDNREYFDYLYIVAWRDLALFCGENLKRGDWVFVEGRVQVRTFEDQGGQKRRSYEIVASEVKRLTGCSPVVEEKHFEFF
ncbi:single-stranded DNA-binding protein [Candidatus Caldatribacterium sp. SIUC1]|uniref:single-stranded DNA-binding protein n=1 Tax=Candidatus Caldatribacterium sp. SIUC1 TaxID=3418365 RepID=UPI003F68D5E4